MKITASNKAKMAVALLNILGEKKALKLEAKDFDEAQKLAEEDLDTILGGIGNSAWVTRLRAELSREALSKDLQLAASDDQSTIPRFIQCKKFVGTQPACPPAPPGCFEQDKPLPGSPGDDPTSVSASTPGGTGCSVGPKDYGSAAFGSFMLLAMVGLRRRRRKRARR